MDCRENMILWCCWFRIVMWFDSNVYFAQQLFKANHIFMSLVIGRMYVESDFLLPTTINRGDWELGRRNKRSQFDEFDKWVRKSNGKMKWIHICKVQRYHIDGKLEVLTLRPPLVLSQQSKQHLFWNYFLKC